MSFNRVLASVLATLVLLVRPPALAAQPAFVRIANPGTVEFEILDQRPAEVELYRIELFSRDADTQVALPVKRVDVQAASAPKVGTIRIDLRERLEGVPDGEYVATIRTIRAGGESPRSQPTTPFFISGHGETGQDQSATQTDEEKRRERFWTKVGLAIGAAAILIPFIFR